MLPGLILAHRVAKLLGRHDPGYKGYFGHRIRNYTNSLENRTHKKDRNGRYVH